MNHIRINPDAQIVLPLNPWERTFPSRHTCQVCGGSGDYFVRFSGDRYREVRCDHCSDESRLQTAHARRRYTLHLSHRTAA